MTVPIGGQCDSCGAPLGFLEGPECDGCVTRPIPPWRDKYEGVRDADDEEPDAPAAASPSVAKDRFAVDLQTRAVVFPR